MTNLKIAAYRGYGTAQRLKVKGRVLRGEPLTTARETTPPWENLLNMYRRFAAGKVPGARVRAKVAGQQAEVVADAQGYFETQIELNCPLQESSLWHEVGLALLEPEQNVSSTAEVLVPPPSARFGVISDVDDTIVQTTPNDPWRMIQSVYLGNARTLAPFPGVSAFYRALQRGVSDREYNPIFYVSSSPLNLYDVFEEFLQVGKLPTGPMLLREREFVPENLFGLGHKGHKLVKIRAILQHYPELPFILIGDSGQEDPEIYAQLVQDYRDRILGIYIRDVSVGDSWRQIQLRAIAKQVRQAGSQFQLVTTTEAAATHAANRGWIAAESSVSVN